MTDYLSAYRDIRERDLKREGIFIGEGRFIVERMLASGWTVLSLLCTEDLAAEMSALAEGVCPVIALPREKIAEIAGFKFHRGILACGKRPEFAGLKSFLVHNRNAKTLVVCESVTNMENLGSIYRTATAFGVDGIALGQHCADPLTRKSIKVSMGAVFSMQTLQFSDDRADIMTLKEKGFEICGTSLEEKSANLKSYKRKEKVALLFGNEALGLSRKITGLCDTLLKIPISPNVDSLNVGVAAGIVLYANAVNTNGNRY
jgi:tRNA G18 (ribose-2'-O)-methylase SpoU